MKKDFSKNILELIEKNSTPISIETIKEKLKVKNKQHIVPYLEKLQNIGKIVKVKKGKFISTKKCGKIPAKIVSLSTSFGFAVPLDDSSTDIFIHARNLKNAFPNDVVLLHKLRMSPKGLSGIVDRVLEKGSRFVTGTIVKYGDTLEILPDNNFRFSIPILKGYTMGAKNEDKVLALINSSPNRHILGAKIVKIYGNSNTAKICADALIDSYNIPTQFDEDTQKEANIIADSKINDDDISSRLDLRNEVIFTIDSEDAKDLDDAISLKRLSKGWLLGVHIADVSHYVKHNSSLDKEAFKRGTSVYFADRVIPMFPKEISNVICSLNPNEDKLTFSALIELDENAKIVSYKFVKSVINSRLKGIYSEINKIITGQFDVNIQQKYREVIEIINEAKILSELMDKNSKSRGIVDIESGESRFSLNQDGVCVDVKPRIQGTAEKIIENFMITANQAAALYAQKLDIPFIYRIHEAPEPEKIRILAELTNLLGLKSHKIREGLSPADLADILGQVRNKPNYKVVSRQVLRTMAKARYSDSPIGHFGLSLDDYCHFTSPIRRYPDICIHRILSDFLSTKDKRKISKKYKNFVEEASKQSTACEIRAVKAERDAEQIYMAEFMSHHIGDVFNGTISGVNPKGIFVELENSVEGFVDLNYYKNCKFSFNGLTCHKDIISGKSLSIGDIISIKVVAVNIPAGKIDFAPTVTDIN